MFVFESLKSRPLVFGAAISFLMEEKEKGVKKQSKAKQKREEERSVWFLHCIFPVPDGKTRAAGVKNWKSIRVEGKQTVND